MTDIQTLAGYAPIPVVARSMGVSIITLRKHIERKHIEVFHLGRSTLIKPESVSGYQPRHYSKQA